MTKTHTSRSLAAVLAAALVGACAGAQKPDAGGKKAVGPGDEGAQGPSTKQEGGGGAPGVSGRAQRLFEDAVKAFNEQKQLKVYDWALLEKKFRLVVDADDRFAEAYFNLGVLAEKQRKVGEAKSLYKEALERKPSLKQAAENLGVLLQNEGKSQDAVAVYQDILRKNPDDGAARARLAAIYREAGDFDRALKLAREALMREPQNLTAYKVMMRVYVERNNLNMAKLVALRALKLSSDPEIHHTLGLIALKEKDEASAIGSFKQAVADRDDYLASRVQLAGIAVKHQDWANAAEQYKKILQYEPGNVAAHNNLGVAYKGLGQFDKAMGEYDAVLKMDSSSTGPYYNIGVLLQKHKDAPEKAIEYYKKFVAVSRGNLPGDHPVFANIKECETYIRQMAEAKIAEAQAVKAAEEQKKQDELKKQQEAQKAKADDEAKKTADQQKREQDAKAVLDGTAGQAKPVPAKGEPPEKAPEAKPAPAKSPEPAAAPAAKASEDEPSDGL